MTYCSYKINNHVKLDLKQEVSPASYFHLSSKIRQKKTSLIKILLTIITQNALLPVVYAILLLDHQQGDVIIKRENS